MAPARFRRFRYNADGTLARDDLDRGIEYKLGEYDEENTDVEGDADGDDADDDGDNAVVEHERQRPTGPYTPASFVDIPAALFD